MILKTKELIKSLELEPHPEGGYYKSTYEALDSTLELQGERKRWTSIYFLLETNEVSNFHELKSDEMWYFHEGESLTIYIINKSGELIEQKLGLDILNGEKPQILVEKGNIFGSALNTKGHSLVGCMVSPGFDFEDFKLYERKELINRYPNHKIIIEKLTR